MTILQHFAGKKRAENVHKVIISIYKDFQI